MLSQIQNATNDTIRLLMAQMNDIENSAYAAVGLAPRVPMQIPPRQIVHAPRTTVNDHSIRIDGSTIGVLNTGTIGSLNSSVSLIQQVNPEHAEQLKALIESISRNNDLAQEARKETIEQISYLLSQISVPKEQQNLSVQKTTYQSIKSMLSTSADLYTLWEAAKNVLVQYLPHLAQITGF